MKLYKIIKNGEWVGSVRANTPAQAKKIYVRQSGFGNNNWKLYKARSI